MNTDKAQYGVNRIPFMFMRRADYSPHNTFVVKMALWDYSHYNAGWMADPTLNPEHYEVYVPSVDLSRDQWVFDRGTSAENEMAALAKMKELWAIVQIVQAHSIDLSFVIDEHGAATFADDKGQGNDAK